MNFPDLSVQQYSKWQTQCVLFSKAKESKVQTRIIVADFGKGLELYDSIRTQLADLEIGTLGEYKREDLKCKIDIMQGLFVCLSVKHILVRKTLFVVCYQNLTVNLCVCWRWVGGYSLIVKEKYTYCLSFLSSTLTDYSCVCMGHAAN